MPDEQKTTGQIIGYARVSTNIQDTAAQVEKLTEAGCTRIFKENASGKDDTRPELQRMIDYIRDGDVVIITKLDRFCRNGKEFWPLVASIEKKGAKLKCLDGTIDTTSPIGVLMTTVAAAFAGFERELIATRRTEGIERARLLGRKFGAPIKLKDPVQIEDILRRYYVHNQAPYFIARLYNVSRNTICRLIERHPVPIFAPYYQPLVYTPPEDDNDPTPPAVLEAQAEDDSDAADGLDLDLL